MSRRSLFLYQLLTGLSDTSTGILLIFAPALTLHLMGLTRPTVAPVFLSFVGAFVLSVGIACLYGGWLVTQLHFSIRLREVWIITAISRGVVATFLLSRMLDGQLQPGWSRAAISDGVFALLQVLGLQRGWLRIAQS
jgi:hypothetical protein